MIYGEFLASGRQSRVHRAKTCHLCRPIFSSQRHGISILTVALLLALAAIRAAGGQLIYLGSGDPIGPNSSTTDGRGGFAAIQQDELNLGEPAISVNLTGQEILQEFRAIVFGNPSPDGEMFFNEFDYWLKFWKGENYFSGAEPEFEIRLGEPMEIELDQNTPETIVPADPFGNAGIFGNNASTYDFHFDLQSLPLVSPVQQVLDAPLEAGEWVIAFQSRHRVDDAGLLSVATSGEAAGPLPLLSRDDDITRGILGGQDPENMFARWGISVTALLSNQGDFNDDGSVNTDDLVLWQSAFGIDDSADADVDGDSDGADFLAWQRNLVGSLISTGVSHGDFDLDFDVDGDDLTIWESSFGVDPLADADADGDSDGGDFLLWQRINGLNVPQSPSLAIPEPNAQFLALASILFWSIVSRSAGNGVRTRRGLSVGTLVLDE